MLTKLTRTVVCMTMATSLSGVAIANPGTGSKTKYNVKIGKCFADTVRVKWNLDTIFGEPTVYGTYKWTGSDCRLPYTTTIWLKLQYNKDSSSYGYVRISPATPKANGSYAFDTKGSPAWRKAVCGYSGTEKRNCFDASDAKMLWKNSSVTDFDIVW